MDTLPMGFCRPLAHLCFWFFAALEFLPVPEMWKKIRRSKEVCSLRFGALGESGQRV
jgi:hypothetical protein